MVQGLNWPAISTAFHLLLNRNLLKPTITVKTVAECDWSFLRKNLGIKYVVLDKDNTLTAPYETKYFNEEIEESVKECKKVFGNNNIAVLSNSAGSGDDKGCKEKKNSELGLDLAVIKHTEKKPSKECFNDILTHFQIDYNERSGVCIVGDRLTTDVAFGNLNGATSVYCRTVLSEVRDNWFAKHLRRLEHKFL